MTRETYPDWLTGCGDGSCIVRPPTGMQTNGGCRCEGRPLRMAVQFWKEQAARNDRQTESYARGRSDAAWEILTAILGAKPRGLRDTVIAACRAAMSAPPRETP